MNAAFPDRLCQRVAVTVMGHRLGRALGEIGMGKLGLEIVHTFLTVAELLRDLALKVPADPLYPVLRAYLAQAVSDATKALKTPAPAIRGLLGEECPLLQVMQEALVLINAAWAPYDDDKGPHPSAAPPLNNTHKRRKSPGGR